MEAKEKREVDKTAKIAKKEATEEPGLFSQTMMGSVKNGSVLSNINPPH